MKVKSRFVLFLFLLSSFLFADVYKENVQASYYADKFHGRKTASGEIFNMYDFTCAHKTLPFGTILRVTNLSNNKSVNVRVNDRGPFAKGREIDVSKAAAQKLDMIKTGTANVRIEIINGKNVTLTPKENKINSSQGVKVKNSSTQTSSTADFWDIQLGSFSDYENANRFAQNLIKNGFDNVYFQKTSKVTRVVIKKIPNSQLKSVESRLRATGYEDFVVKKNS